jgi:cobalt/nickel transport system permease protein
VSRLSSWIMLALFGAFLPVSAWGMHITEGLLPLDVAAGWFALTLPFLMAGVVVINRRKKESPSYMPMLGIFGAAVFVFSCLPIPIPGVGVTAHPAGTGFSAILVGPLPSVVLAFISLLLQGLFLAHGGVTTLGANTFSMGVLGSFAGFFGFIICRKLKLNLFLSGFVAGACADIFTYAGTSLTLASGLRGTGDFFDIAGTIALLLTPYVAVLALIEGFVTGGILVYVKRNRPDILRRLKILPAEEAA